MTDALPAVKHLTAPVRFKAAADDTPEGLVEAIVSVFGNVDSVGDVVISGAFEESLAAWAAKGDPIPFVWSHDWNDPFSHIGEVLEAKEIDEGLYIKAQLDLSLYANGAPVNPKAHQVARLLKQRRVTQFSFAYDTLDASWAERDGRDVYELRKLGIHEVGPTLIGANRETSLLAAKAEAHKIATSPQAAKADDDPATAPAGGADTPNPHRERVASRLARYERSSES